MKEIIGEMAGRVWKTLGKKGRVEISKLPQILKEKGEIVYQGLRLVGPGRENNLS